MDVETTADRIIPTTNFVNVVHPNMPTSTNTAQLDGSIDYRKSFDVPWNLLYTQQQIIV